MKKILFLLTLLTFFALSVGASGIAEEQLLGGTQENILEGLIKTVDELNEYEEVLKIIEEEQETSEVEEPVPPVVPEEPTVEEPIQETEDIIETSAEEPALI